MRHFSGVERRFQKRGTERGVTVIDDYGHHPTEIRATLAAARFCNARRFHVLFQPHRYTRTAALMDDFARAFNQADRVLFMDIYAASEKPIEGVSRRKLWRSARANSGTARRNTLAVWSAGIEAILEGLEPEDLIITLGAGSVTQAGDMILARLRNA